MVGQYVRHKSLFVRVVGLKISAHPEGGAGVEGGYALSKKIRSFCRLFTL